MIDLKSITGLILDMDGVLWRGDQAIGPLPEMFQRLQSAGIKVTYATNNATRDEQQYVDKLKNFGVDAEPSQIVNSSMVASEHLFNLHPQGGPLFVIGEKGLVNTLGRRGFYHSESSPLAVVVGMDLSLTYEKMSKAALLINKGVPFVGTNPDKSFPTPEGETIGTGAIIAAISAATGVDPFICGKPSPHMMELALKRMNALKENTLVVGDRYETDILGGINAGFPTALVLSGVTPANIVQNLNPAPDFIFSDLEALINDLLA